MTKVNTVPTIKEAQQAEKDLFEHQKLCRQCGTPEACRTYAALNRVSQAYSWGISVEEMAERELTK